MNEVESLKIIIENIVKDIEALKENQTTITELRLLFDFLEKENEKRDNVLDMQSELLRDMSKTQHELYTNVKMIGEQVKRTSKDIEINKADIVNLQNKPAIEKAKMYDNIKWFIIKIVLGAILGGAATYYIIMR